MTEEIVTGGEGRAQAKEAGAILNDASPISRMLALLVTPIVVTANLIFGARHHDVVAPVGLATIATVLLVAGRLYHRGRTPGRVEAALATLARGSDPAALRALITFVNRQRWSPEETARLTARHLPMARRAILQERRFYPGGLVRWIETLRTAGVVSEDLDAVAQRVDELRSPLNADLGRRFRRD